MSTMFKRLLCKHAYIEDQSIYSKRVDNDNHVIAVTLKKCQKCGKYSLNEETKKIEKNWYAR